MNFAILIGWGNCLKVIETSKTKEGLGEINKIHHWVIKRKAYRLKLYDLIAQGELEDFEILQRPGDGRICV